MRPRIVTTSSSRSSGPSSSRPPTSALPPVPPNPVGEPLRGADAQVREAIPELRVAHSEPT